MLSPLEEYTPDSMRKSGVEEMTDVGVPSALSTALPVPFATSTRSVYLGAAYFGLCGAQGGCVSKVFSIQVIFWRNNGTASAAPAVGGFQRQTQGFLLVNGIWTLC